VGSAACWFNTAAFARNPVVNGVPVDGNTPRNFINQPSYRDVDLAISRNFKVSERLNLQLRGEALNVFNIVSLNAPNATAVANVNLPGQTFGTINTALPMRQLQIGLRFAF
jgi:hypothetical protein